VRVALLSSNARAGDAVGNSVAEKLAFFLDRGADVRVYVESTRDLHSAVRPHCRTLDPRRLADGDWSFLTTADLVVAEFGHAYPLLGLLPLLGEGKPRLLIDYHGVTPPELWGAHNREVLAQGVRQRGIVWCADAALAHSRFALDELVRDTRLPRERVEVVGHPVDAAFLRPGPPGRDLREHLGTGPATLLLFVGRLAPNKRAPVLVEALACLTDLTPPAHAVLVGDTGDVYRDEADRCRARAAELGVADRLHVLGRLSNERLRDAYRSADVFVMPSMHEGFCVPVIEAMACGLPVVACRAAALPETVAAGGLSFTPDDPADLARQVRRVLTSRDQDKATAAPVTLSPCHPVTMSQPLRVAVVSYRYGTGFAGGAETSLRTIAETLHGAGHAVEVFTTCTRGEGNWQDDEPEGTTRVGGVPVHRFRVNAPDASRRRQAVQAVLHAGGDVTAEIEQEYLTHSLHSDRLLDALRRRADRFDAIITGPYSVGLTHDVARAFTDKTLLLPCFHDEPLAYLKAWLGAYGDVGGVLYHTPEEQDLAQSQLGLNHPRAACCGTFVDAETSGDSARGRARVGSPLRYVVYCGRYSEQKGLPAVFDGARAYAAEHPERLLFVFMGEGGCAIPREPWARDLGFVDEATKRDVLAGAAALVLLSEYESLSLAVLEAWSQAVPVLVQRQCPVLVGHLARGGGGRAVTGPEELTAALDDLWRNPHAWQALGRRGREYVRRRYGSRSAFAQRLTVAVQALRQPLADCMRRRGFERAAGFHRPHWRQQFAEVVERLLDAPARERREHVEVTSRSAERTAAAATKSTLIPVRVTNRGTQAAVAEGPARLVIRGTVSDGAGRACGEVADTPLPALLVPGQSLAAAVAVPVPDAAGVYRVALHAEREAGRSTFRTEAAGGSMNLIVEPAGTAAARGSCSPLLDLARAALAEAERFRRLPVDYHDVTEGRFARWKRWVKRKLLGNFKHAYVDVLSRQQSAFNQQVLSALAELAECCATLDHARAVAHSEEETAAILRHALVESHRRCRELEARVERLEALLKAKC
jgi:glycosyltransferase involved in cell wall biosynthesis